MLHAVTAPGMLRANPRRMRPARAPLAPVLLAILTACGESSVSLSGTMVPGSDASEVFVLGAAERAQIEADSFSLSGVGGDTVELRFTTGGEEPARMLLIGLPAGQDVHLEGIWIEDGVAHAARVRGDPGGSVLVNGLRMAPASALPREVAAHGTVLSASGEGDAILLRPADESLPDLRVVITPGTVLRTVDGAPARGAGDAGELEYGDSVRVMGQGVDGYVVATEVILPTRRRD